MPGTFTYGISFNLYSNTMYVFSFLPIRLLSLSLFIYNPIIYLYHRTHEYLFCTLGYN